MDNAHRIVSSEAEELILVDRDDKETGYLSKADCHNGEGILHRAFSVFLFDDNGRMLLQRRAATKRLWPDYWSNSCCSHPRRGESMAVATRRRLQDELNLHADLEYAYKFTYHAAFGQLGSERELCHVYLGLARGEMRPNDHEVSQVRFVSVGDLDAELAAEPDRFTPWFKLEWSALREQHAGMLSRYAL